jgi:hypothetical protein
MESPSALAAQGFFIDHAADDASVTMFCALPHRERRAIVHRIPLRREGGTKIKCNVWRCRVTPPGMPPRLTPGEAANYGQAK